MYFAWAQRLLAAAVEMVTVSPAVRSVRALTFSALALLLTDSTILPFGTSVAPVLVVTLSTVKVLLWPMRRSASPLPSAGTRTTSVPASVQPVVPLALKSLV